MGIATLKTGHIPEGDRLLSQAKSLVNCASWEKVVPLSQEETVPAKGAVYGGHELRTATYGFHVYGATSPAKYDVVGFATELASPGAIFQVSPGVKGCVGVADMFGALGTADTMEAKPTEASATPSRLREVRPAPELYPDLDLDRIKERAAELRAASSDSEAISMVLGRSVQIVVDENE